VSIPATITILSGQTTGTVTINVFDDTLVEPTETATFTISNPTSGITLGATTTATVSITDNDPAPAAPTITSANNTTFTQGTAGSFQVTATGNPAPTFSTTGPLPTGVTLSSSGLLSGTPTQSGTFMFTITATNGTASDATQPFTLTVNPPPNTAPTISDIPNQTGNVGTPLTVNFTVGDAETLNGATVTATSSNTAVAPNPTVTYTSPNTTGSVTLNPAAVGTTTITVTVTDAGGLSSSDTFVLTVGAALPDLTISQSAPTSVTTGGSITYTLTASNSGTTALNNVGVNFTLPTGVTYVASSSSCTTSTAPAMGGTGTVAFSGCTIAANSTTTLTVTVLVPLTAQTITSDGTNVVIDPGLLIAESNEGNNTAAPVTTMVTVRATAATVAVSGRVMTASGGGITRVRVTLTDSQGNVRTAFTTSNGEYRFDDVEVGATYILTATGKHYTFSQPMQVLSINDETDGINFVANEGKRIRSF
jgi:uncharacterized repeat protein (TIGR01451 family)